jgi:hypothetical protein
MAAAVALNLAFAAPSHAQVSGTNSAVEDNVQTIEQFRGNWNSLLDRAAKARSIQHHCADGLCDWEWELRPHVQARMVESNNGSHQAFYCFLAEPATSWDCYGNTLQKWVWNPPRGDDSPPYTPAPVVDTNAVPIFTDGRRAHVSAMIGSISAIMLIDTGASVASVNAWVAQALVASGEADALGPAEVGLAGGQTVTEYRVIIHQIALGTHVATNVLAVINANDDDMLLSLPALNQMGKFTIDTARSQLVFGSPDEARPSAPPPAVFSAPPVKPAQPATALETISAATAQGKIVEKCITDDKVLVYVINRGETIRASDGAHLSETTNLNTCASLIGEWPAWYCPWDEDAAVCSRAGIDNQKYKEWDHREQKRKTLASFWSQGRYFSWLVWWLIN